MERQITYESVLELIERQSVLFHRSLEESRKDFDIELKKSRKDFDKKLGEITGTWGRFVAEMVQPKIIDMFRERGIAIEMSAQSVKGFKDKQVFYEIDILLVDTDVAVAVEVKSTLTREDVVEHLERLDKIKQVAPKLFNLSGMQIYGAVAGMIVENKADKYAYQNGLFVLRQKGSIVEIMNDEKFQPKIWKADY